VLEGMAEQLVEVVGADVVRVVAKGRDARVDLLGPLLVRLDDGEGVELGVGGLLAGSVAVEPSVDVDARPLWRVSDRRSIATGQGLPTEEPASRTTPYRPTHRSSSASGRTAGPAFHTFSHGDGGSLQLPAEAHAAVGMRTWSGYEAGAGSKRVAVGGVVLA
jgi:hypothetical protein